MFREVLSLFWSRSYNEEGVLANVLNLIILGFNLRSLVDVGLNPLFLELVVPCKHHCFLQEVFPLVKQSILCFQIILS